MSHRESYRVITVIRVNCTSNVVTVAVWGCMSQGLGMYRNILLGCAGDGEFVYCLNYIID